jgi:hypothetical protein
LWESRSPQEEEGVGYPTVGGVGQLGEERDSTGSPWRRRIRTILRYLFTAFLFLCAKRFFTASKMLTVVSESRKEFRRRMWHFPAKIAWWTDPNNNLRGPLGGASNGSAAGRVNHNTDDNGSVPAGRVNQDSSHNRVHVATVANWVDNSASVYLTISASESGVPLTHLYASMDDFPEYNKTWLYSMQYFRNNVDEHGRLSGVSF